MRKKTSASDARPHRRVAIPEPIRQVLWARAAGRCQYSGCNDSLIGDLISGSEDKRFGFIAHIVADSPEGPRGDAVRSPLLAKEISNLMLLCDTHHRVIDVHAVEEHPEARLQEMKAEHERRVELVTAIGQDRATHVLRYAANIGAHESPVTIDSVLAAVLPRRYPAEARAIDLELLGSAYQDREPEFWKIQRENLRRQFEKKIRPRVEAREIAHLSVFALAPQPLLMELGRLLGDILPTDVHQLKREPSGWGWEAEEPVLTFKVRKPASKGRDVALVLALSATITDDRITRVLGEDVAIWSLSVEQPHNDLMKRSGDLAEFRTQLRKLLNEIKATHGEQAILHVFPALPVSAAVEVGRVWMPKADLPLTVYDQGREANGFAFALRIGGRE